MKSFTSGDLRFITQKRFDFILFAFYRFVDTWLFGITTFSVQALIIFSLLTFELRIGHKNISGFPVIRHWTCQINFIFESVRYIFRFEYCFGIRVLIVIVSGSGPSLWWLRDLKLSVSFTIYWSNTGCTRLIFASRMMGSFPNGFHNTYLSVHGNVVVRHICFPRTINLSSIEMAIHRQISFSTGLQTLVYNYFVVFIQLVDGHAIAHESLCTIQTCLIYETQLGVFLKWNQRYDCFAGRWLWILVLLLKLKSTLRRIIWRSAQTSFQCGLKVLRNRSLLLGVVFIYFDQLRI